MTNVELSFISSLVFNCFDRWDYYNVFTGLYDVHAWFDLSHGEEALFGSREGVLLVEVESVMEEEVSSAN